MKISPRLTHPQSILGVYDLINSDELNQSKKNIHIYKAINIFLSLPLTIVRVSRSGRWRRMHAQRTCRWVVYRSKGSKVSFLKPVAQWLEHCVSSAKVVGSIPREHTYLQYKCIAWMHCKSLWIKASAKCINVNVSKGKPVSFWLITKSSDIFLWKIFILYF